MSTQLAMPDGEIAVRYRQAKEPQKQIEILAELCDTSKHLQARRSEACRLRKNTVLI